MGFRDESAPWLTFWQRIWVFGKVKLASFGVATWISKTILCGFERRCPRIDAKPIFLFTPNW